jgi:hypothetical protein
VEELNARHTEIQKLNEAVHELKDEQRGFQQQHAAVATDAKASQFLLQFHSDALLQRA